MAREARSSEICAGLAQDVPGRESRVLCVMAGYRKTASGRHPRGDRLVSRRDADSDFCALVLLLGALQTGQGNISFSLVLIWLLLIDLHITH